MHKDDQFSKADGQRTKLSGITGASLSYLPGDIVDNDYQLLKLLGRGGMGAVYACRHLKMDRTYALKLLSGDTVTGEAWTRFQAEAKSLARLNHPGIVTVYNMGIDKNQCPYFVMDLLAGETLDMVLKHSSRLKSSIALDIFIQVADALASAHLQSIIHRDIKPSNLMLVQAERDQPERVKIVDFGIARVPKAGAEAQSQTATGLIFGTPFYMSPEQCQGAKVDQRSDIYSFGCTLFEALSGEPPFVGESAFHTFMMHQTEAPPPLPLDVGGQPYPESLQLALKKMLNKKPSDRYQTMNQVKHDLERIKAGKLIMAQGVSETLPPSNQRKGYVASGGGGAAGSRLDKFGPEEYESAEKTVSHFPLHKVAVFGLVLLVVVGGLMTLLLRDNINFKKAKIDMESDPYGDAWNKDKKKKDEAKAQAAKSNGNETKGTGGTVDGKGQIPGADKGQVPGADKAQSDRGGHAANTQLKFDKGNDDDDEPKRDPSKKHSNDMLDDNFSETEKNAKSLLKIDDDLKDRMPANSPIYPWQRMIKFGASRDELLSVDVTELFELDPIRRECEDRWRKALASPPLATSQFLRGQTFDFPPDMSLGSIRIDNQPLKFAIGRVPTIPGKDAYLYMLSPTRKIPEVLNKFGPDDLTGVAMVFDGRAEVNRAIDILLKWRRLKDLWFFNPILKTIAVNTDSWAESQIADEDLPRLDMFRGLRSIGICYPATGPAIMKRPFLKTVQGLGLRRIDDFAPLLKELPHLDNLKELLLMTLETTDRDLQTLTRMKNLQKLTILRGYLTLDSLRYFKQMKALRELHLDRNDWSPAQKEDFKKNLPHCKVSFEKVIDLDVAPMDSKGVSIVQPFKSYKRP